MVGWVTISHCQSCQDGGVGRYSLPPHTTKRRTTTLKTKNNQNCQNIGLYGSPTTKEIKKTHSSRLVGGAEMGSRGREVVWQGCSYRTWWFRICKWINWEEKLGSKADRTIQRSSMGKESLKISVCKNLWGWWWWDKLPASQKSLLERPTGS